MHRHRRGCHAAANSTGRAGPASITLRGLSIARAAPDCRGEPMNKPITDLQHPKMLLDPYAAWAEKEGVPVTEDFGVDLLAVPTAPRSEERRVGKDGRSQQGP